MTYEDDRIARIYDWIVYGTPEAGLAPDEWEFLQEVFRRAERDIGDVLDVGCGTGRHVLPMARAGYYVMGIDSSPGMVKQCRRRLHREELDAEVFPADLMDMYSSEYHDAALCMDSVICYLPTVDDVREGLLRLHEAIRPGGVLVLDNHNFLHHAGSDGEPIAGELSGEGMEISYVQRQWYDDFASVFHVELEAEVREEGETWEVSTEEVLRVMTAAELGYYLEDAGFVDITVLPDYDLAPPVTPSSERIIFIAHRAPEEE